MPGGTDRGCKPDGPSDVVVGGLEEIFQTRQNEVRLRKEKIGCDGHQQNRPSLWCCVRQKDHIAAIATDIPPLTAPQRLHSATATPDGFADRLDVFSKSVTFV